MTGRPTGKWQRLTPLQERFVAEYLIDLNASEAGLRAGSKHRDYGRQLISKPHIQAEIAKRRERISQKADVQAADVLLALARIAFADIRKLYDEHGNLKPIHELDDDTAAALAGIEVEEIYAGRGDEREQIGMVKKVRRYDKPKALELLGKHLALFPTRAEMTGPGGGPLRIEIVDVGSDSSADDQDPR